MKGFSSAFAVLGALASVNAHATFQEASVNGVDQAKKCTRLPLSNSPVTSVTSNDIRCNAGTKAAEETCDATAGESFTVEMHQQPNDRACGTEAIGGNHFGPVLVYMSKVDDAAAADGSAAWFKVDEFGYDAANKTWGTDLLNANCGKRTFTIPSRIPAGDYLVRAEAIALHAASQVGGAQFYMSCYQVKLASSGAGQVPAGVQFPGAYGASDPGIKVDIYGSGFKSYEIPGPKVIDSTFF